MDFSNYERLIAKVDDFFERVSSSLGDEIQCDRGCSDCCHVRLSITSVEADYIRAGVAKLSPNARRDIAQEAGSDDHSRCAALGEDGRCKIYEHRPVICRSHGLPIVLRESGSLPVVQSCHRNFQGGLDQVPEPALLDQKTLTTNLAVVNSLHCEESGALPEDRIDLAALLVRLGDAG